MYWVFKITFKLIKQQKEVLNDDFFLLIKKKNRLEFDFLEKG